MIHATLMTLAACALQSGAAIASTPKDSIIVVQKSAIAESGDNAQTIELHALNENIKVLINGKEVSPDRIQKDKNGQVTVFDEQGNVIQTFNVNSGFTFDDVDFQWNLDFGDNFKFFEQQIADWRDRVRVRQPTGSQAESPRVMIGVHMDEPSEALQRHLKLKPGETTILNGVLEGLPAHRAGLDAYDIIIAINDKAPAGQQQIHESLRQLNPGDVVRFTVLHEGLRKDVTVKVDAYDTQALGAARVIGEPQLAIFQNFMTPLTKDATKGINVHRKGEIMELLLVPSLEHDGLLRHAALLAPRMQLKMQELGKNPDSDESNIETSIERSLEDAVKADMADLGDRLKRLEELLQKLTEKRKQGTDSP